MNKTKADECALDIQTDELMREGVFAILGADHVCIFKDSSMLLDVNPSEFTVHDVMDRHGFEPYTFPTDGAENTFWNLRYRHASSLYVSTDKKKFQVVAFTGWESENGDQMRIPARFLAVEDVTKVVMACNEAEEISDEDLEAAADF